MNVLSAIILRLSTWVYPYKTYGTENIPQGAAVIPYNHLSFMDPLFVRHTYKGKMIFPAKKELFKNKLLGWLIGACGAIPVDRANPGADTLFAMIKTLRRGEKLVISPEGTRNKTGSTDFLPFKEGTVLFALKGKAPIVPCIVASHARPFKKTHICFGKPFDFSEYYGKKLSDEEMAELNEILVKKMQETQKEFLAFLAEKKNKKRKKNKKTKGDNVDARI